MANLDPANNMARDTAERFLGMDRSLVAGTADVAQDICNFRVLADGTLEKREGYRTLAELPAAVRGVWAGNVGGCETLLAAAGSHVYLLAQDGAVLDVPQILVTLGTQTGIANFFCVEGCVYMLDGDSIYCYDGVGMTEADAYAPLYGHSWHPLTGGEVNEPFNAFSRHVRLHYLMAVSSSYLALQLPFASVDAVYHNHRALDASDYTLSEDGYTLNFDYTVAANLTIIVYGTLAASVDTGAAVRSCSHTVTMGGEFDDRVFLYHGSQPSDIYVSNDVVPGELADARKVWPGLKNLYFSQGEKLTVDDGKSEITALCRHYDRLLVFRRDGTCMANLAQGADGSIYPAMPVNSTVGCASPEALCLYGNDPITVNDRGIWRWLQTTDERDECNAVRISDKVATMLSRDFCRRAQCVCRADRGEVWFYDPQDETGGILILSPSTGAWYRFSGVRMQGCFRYDGADCFYFDTHLYRFSRELVWDEPQGEQRDIDAHYEAVGLHLGQPWQLKRMGRCMVTYSGEGMFEVALESDRGGRRSFRFASDGRTPVRLAQRRMPVGRFVFARCRITAWGAGHQRVHGLTLTALK